MWGLLIAVLYLLLSFLLLIFLTFVFAYIQAHGVDGLAHRIKNRPVRVVIVGLVVLGSLFATGFTLVPQVTDQATTFSKNRDKVELETGARGTVNAVCTVTLAAPRPPPLRCPTCA